jgi:hypothetical protein
MSHKTPKEMAIELWREMADLAEREGGLVETSVVDLFERVFKAFEADIKKAAFERRPERRKYTLEEFQNRDFISVESKYLGASVGGIPLWVEDYINWNDVGFMYYGISYGHGKHCCVFDHSDEYPMCDYCGKSAFRSEE